MRDRALDAFLRSAVYACRVIAVPMKRGLSQTRGTRAREIGDVVIDTHRAASQQAPWLCQAGGWEMRAPALCSR